jgi:predicted Zn finger-like uncharacterized protein
MILTCPQCETRYQADASKFSGASRKVRCAKCGHVWLQEPPAPEAPEPGSEIFAKAEPAPVAAKMPPEPQPSAFAPTAEKVAAPVSAVRKRAPLQWRQHIGVAAGWLGLVVVILLLGWSALAYRQQIATVWPQASSVYAALGLHVNTRGLDFVDVAYHSETEDGQPVLAVSGKLVNISAHELSVPAIEVTLTDDNRHTLYHWSFNSNVATLRPGETEAFLTRLSSPPSGARHLELRFAEAGG